MADSIKVIKIKVVDVASIDNSNTEITMSNKQNIKFIICFWLFSILFFGISKTSSFETNSSINTTIKLRQHF